MCAPIQADTCVHTPHSKVVDPDLHPVVLASAGKEQREQLGLAGLALQGIQLCSFDVENQSRMNHHKESCWGRKGRENRLGGEEKDGGGGGRGEKSYGE